MTCRNCGTDIAEKALICYRCGTATSAPRIAPPPAPKARGPIPLVVTLLVIAAAGFFAVPSLATDSMRMAGWAGAAVAAAVSVWLLRPTSRARKRRPRP